MFSSPHSGCRRPHGGLLCGWTPDGHSAQGLLTAICPRIQGMQVQLSLATVGPEQGSPSGSPCTAPPPSGLPVLAAQGLCCSSLLAWELGLVLQPRSPQPGWLPPEKGVCCGDRGGGHHMAAAALRGTHGPHPTSDVNPGQSDEPRTQTSPDGGSTSMTADTQTDQFAFSP